MSKIDEAIEILILMGIPKAQQNDRSALTLLAVLDVNERKPLERCKRAPDYYSRHHGIHQVKITK